MKSTDYVNLVSQIGPLIISIGSIFIFSLYTRNKERAEGQSMFLGELRTQTDIVHASLDLINQEETREIINCLKLKGTSALTEKQKSDLVAIILKVDNTIQLVGKQTIEQETWIKFFKKGIWGRKRENEDLHRRLDISGGLSTQIGILAKFVVDVGKHISKTDDLYEEIGTVHLNEIYMELLGEELFTSEVVNKMNDTNANDKTFILLMVALNGKKTNAKWSEQSLGNWKISSKNKDKIDYILGIDTKTRNIVSIVAPSSSEVLEDGRVKFKVKQTLYNNEEKILEKNSNLQLNEAANWNARNPVKYLKFSEEDFKRMLNKVKS